MTMPGEPAPPLEPQTSLRSLVWLGRYASWGMPLAYIVIVALSAIGIKAPAILFFIGGGALWSLQKLLKKEQAHEYALAARRVVRIQIGLMLGAELLAVVMLFLLPRETWPLITGVGVFGAFALHIIVAILGSHRLGSIADRHI
jgi:hypothetical protein